MEHNEEKNMQNEIIDSLTKKFTQLENRQQKVESMELDKLHPRVKDLETKAANYPTADILAYNKEIERLGGQLNTFDAKINAIPKELPVKHQFDPKSKFVIKIILGLGLAVAILIAISISLWIENDRRADVTNKFLILRGFYPDVAKYIDSAYTTNADFLIKKANAKIDEQQTMSEAAFEAKQAAEESKLADKKLKELKGKNQTAGKQKRKK
jgi:hypothetical protein